MTRVGWRKPEVAEAKLPARLGKVDLCGRFTINSEIISGKEKTTW